MNRAGLPGGEGQERDLIDRGIDGDVRAVARDEASRGRAVGSEAIDERRREDVEVVWPAVMTERPDDLDAVTIRRVDKWRQRREVIRAALLHEMPAHAFAGHADAETAQPGIVLVHQLD